MQNVEIEYKVMIQKEDYEKIILSLKDKECKVFDQTNTYFDTATDELKKHKVSLRIREYVSPHYFLLTLKEPLLVGRLEHEEIVKDNMISSCSENIKNILKKYNVTVDDIIETAKLRTIRNEYEIDGCHLCLDHSFYYGIEDYEIECEALSMEQSKKVINDITSPLNINYTPSKLTKIGRARRNKKRGCSKTYK